jgi:hypothetical protein
MCAWRLVLLVAVLIAINAAVAYAQAERNFPTDEEVGLLLTQTDRALERYQPLLDEQEAQIGKSVAEDVANDRKLVNSVQASIKVLSAKRQSFNGPLGFAFFESLVNMDRNALRCGFAASSQSSGYVIAGDHDKADALLHLSQKCMDLSMLIYTIGENASSLYKRFIQAEDQWAAHSTQEARQCEDALEKNRPKKFDPVF